MSWFLLEKTDSSSIESVPSAEAIFQPLWFKPWIFVPIFFCFFHPLADTHTKLSTGSLKITQQLHLQQQQNYTHKTILGFRFAGLLTPLSNEICILFDVFEEKIKRKQFNFPVYWFYLFGFVSLWLARCDGVCVTRIGCKLVSFFLLIIIYNLYSYFSCMSTE